MYAHAIRSLVARLAATAGICATLGTGAGCVRSEVQDAEEPLRQTMRVALTFTRIGPGDGHRFEAVGHFARYPAAEADRVPALLGLPDDDALPLDGCRLVDKARELDEALAVARAPFDVKLLDAGRIEARGPLDATPLQPKHVPELTPFVTGVVYGGEPQLLGLQPGGLYEVRGDGSDAVGAFFAQVQAPRAFASLDVRSYRRGGDLEVKWADAGEVAEPAMLTIAWSTHDEAREVRCRVRDDGSFVVGREYLAALPPESRLSSAELSFARSHRAPLRAAGAPEPGEVSIALREVMVLPVWSWPATGAAMMVPPTAPPAPAEPGEAGR